MNKLSSFDTFGKYLIENPRILGEVFSYEDRIY